MTDTLVPDLGATDHTAATRVMTLLARGVPLSLLLDLAAPVPSRELLTAEPADTSWLRTA